MGQANNYEVLEEFGASMKMVHDPAFSKLMDSSRETLQMKMTSGQIEGKHMQVARICIDNITILMQQSNCDRDEVLAVASADAGPKAVLAPSEMDPREHAIRQAIAQTIAADFAKDGREISGGELAQLVDVEYRRVSAQFDLSSVEVPAVAQPAGTGSSWHRPADASETRPISRLSKSNSSPIADSGSDIEAHVIRSNPAASSSAAGASSASLGALTGIDWSKLQSAVKTIEQVSQPEMERPRETFSSRSRVLEEETDNLDLSDYDDLTVEDLTALFKNFKKLDRENQKNLVEYMKKIERTDPAKVNELKRHIHG